jgi:hypothetical protein
MKKFITITMALTLSALSFADSRTMNTEVGPDSEMLEAEEYDESLDADEVNEERMEESRNDRFIKSEDEIDYNDRTRTNRERKAINTGSDASDDQ